MSETLANNTFDYLIKGDLSGIQSFIFNVKSTGAARSLKGRSFFLKLLLELGMQLVFDTLNLTSESTIQQAKISTSGGNFILQVPGKPETQIQQLQARLNHALQFTGLNYILVCAPLNAYQDSLKALNAAARERKYNLLLQDHSFFEPFHRENFQNVLSNSKWEKITDQLKRAGATHFKIERAENSNEIARLEITKDRVSLAGYQITFGTTGIPLDRYLESVFPIKGNQTILFEYLAKSDRFNRKNRTLEMNGGEKGVEKLGILAMDVDNLGAAIESVADAEAHRQFDLELQRFFNDQLRQIIERGTYTDFGKTYPKYKNKVYPVTAGGDDTLFVGKWNTLLDLAGEIRAAFLQEFAARGLSISAALVIVKPNFPVVRFADLAEEALKAAKYTYKEQKGNIHLFGEVLDWDIFQKEIQPMRSKFAKEANKVISNGMLAKARQTAAKVSEQEGITLSDLWLMGYYFRDAGHGGKGLLKEHRKQLTKSLSERNTLKSQSYRLIFPVAARLAEFDDRHS